MFIVRVVVVSWQQLNKAVPQNDALRWSRAVCAFVKQPDVYFDDGIPFVIGMSCTNTIPQNISRLTGHVARKRLFLRRTTGTEASPFLTVESAYFPFSFRVRLQSARRDCRGR